MVKFRLHRGGSGIEKVGTHSVGTHLRSERMRPACNERQSVREKIIISKY